MTDIEIRRAEAEDAEAIAAAEREIFPDPWSESDILSTVSAEGSMCYAALSDKRIVAYIIARQIAPEGEIYRIATLPEKRRCGIALMLLCHLVREEGARGLKFLYLEVREQNEAARSLYSSFGFKEIGVRKGYYKNPSDNAVLMMYELSTQ